MIEDNNPYAFISSDIVCWNGLISEYGSISHLSASTDNIRRANEEEVNEYKNVKQK